MSMSNRPSFRLHASLIFLLRSLFRFSFQQWENCYWCSEVLKWCAALGSGMCPSLIAWKKLMKTGRENGWAQFFPFIVTWNSDGRCACTCHAPMYQDSCSPPLCSLNLGNRQENAWQWKEYFNLCFLWLRWPKRSKYYIHCGISLPPSESFFMPKVGSKTGRRLNPLSSRAFLLSGEGPTTSSPFYPAKIV